MVFATIVMQERVAPVFTHSKRLYTNMCTAVYTCIKMSSKASFKSAANNK